MDWVFFADTIYDSFNGILFTIFNAIYGDFSSALRVFLNTLFHFFIIIYAFLAVRSGIITSAFSILRTIGLLLITFNLSFNYQTFKTWVFEFIIDFPTDVASYFVSSTISSMVPGFKPPESFSTSQMFGQLSNTLIKRAQASNITKLGLDTGFPSFEGAYLYFIVILVVILYFAFWIIQFNFLVQVSIYLIIGIPILMLASFKETQQIFFEWLRAVVTLMLYPILASIIMFLILNMILPLTNDVKNIVNDSQVGLSATGTLFCVLIFGIYSMRFIPAMAAVLTRGHMTTGNPIQFAQQAAGKVYDHFKGSGSGFMNDFRKNFGTGKLDSDGSSSGRNKSPDKTVVDTKEDSVQIPASMGQLRLAYTGSPQNNQAVRQSNPYQIPPALPAPSASTTQSSSTVDQHHNPTNEISLKPESVTNVPDNAPVGHTPSVTSRNVSSPGSPPSSGPDPNAVSIAPVAQSKTIEPDNGPLNFEKPGTEDNNVNEGDHGSQSVSNQTYTNQRQVSQTSQINDNLQHSSSQNNQLSNNSQNSINTVASNNTAGNVSSRQTVSGPNQTVNSQSSQVLSPTINNNTSPTHRQTDTKSNFKTTQTNSTTSGQKGGPSILPDSSPGSTQSKGPQQPTENEHAPKIDIKD